MKSIVSELKTLPTATYVALSTIHPQSQSIIKLRALGALLFEVGRAGSPIGDGAHTRQGNVFWIELPFLGLLFPFSGWVFPKGAASNNRKRSYWKESY
ncbi:hypothetical protein NS226_16805 [Aureimonas ureilytica]|uniref:Uncharacterized protein n=1 Tax=Aureimonas ureilytica TaxID=401562 RepID=A0A175R4W3_9HYPH|nr:hypothetical protein [Aureimonas ureilytica]KTQ89468.1 hypothetical protein NS226_16805 [Aureimonas ureilytica]